jgi:hypothetical protein
MAPDHVDPKFKSLKEDVKGAGRKASQGTQTNLPDRSRRARPLVRKIAQDMQQPCPSYQMRRLDILTAKQAAVLVSAFAAEENGLLPPDRGKALHCSTRSHPHLNGTPSLQIRSSEDEKDTVQGISCHGRCGCKVRRISDYLSLIGPEGAQNRFWTKERVSEVLASFRKSEAPALGWLEWKKAQGLPVGGIKADQVLIARVPTSTLIQSGARFSAKYAAAFLQRDPIRLAALPAMIKEVSDERRWEPQIVRRLIDERLLALERPGEDPSNVLMHFAYRGFYENPPNVPARIMKQKILHRKEGDGAARGFAFDEDVRSLAVADFSAVGVFYQEAPRIAFWEGEPDSITWRHYHPKDAIVCLGNVNMYKQAIEMLPLLQLKNRTVILGSDRDQAPDGRLRNKELVANFADAIAAQEPRSILLWMCPQIEGQKCKDLNDFRLAFGPETSPERFLKSFAFKAREPAKVLDRALFAALNARIPAPRTHSEPRAM